MSVCRLRVLNRTTPTRRFQTYLTREDITKDTPEKSLVEGKKRTGGRDCARPDLEPLHRRRRQAGLSHHRFQARQSRCRGQGGGDRIRSEPLGAHCAAALRRWREALHHLPGRSRSGPHGELRVRKRTFWSAMHCR